MMLQDTWQEILIKESVADDTSLWEISFFVQPVIVSKGFSTKYYII